MARSQSNFNKQLISLAPDAVIDMYSIDFSHLQANFDMLKDLHGINLGADTIYRFCPMVNSANPIYWQGKAYQPLPVKMEGFEHQSDGRLPRPKMSIANPEGIFSKIVRSNFDFANCKITRKRTFAKFLDDANFQNRGLNEQGENPFGKADPDSHFPDDVFFINKKTSEDKNALTFELVSALELKDSGVPARIIMPNFCGWSYRCSVGCGYKGLAIETVDGADLTQVNGSTVDPTLYPNGLSDIPEWKRNGSIGTELLPGGYSVKDLVKITPRNSTNPYKSTPIVFVCLKGHELASRHHPFLDTEYWGKDECSKTLDSCKKRFKGSSDPLLVEDFEGYVNNHSDLLSNFSSHGGGRTKAKFGEDHWLAYGNNEGRTMNYKKPIIENFPSDHNKHDLTFEGLRFGGFPGTERYPAE
tara:strand:- start:969 stop:2213 length:1245 start_codon:yes stop_codon:yes gene_type:complete